jgi:hypothetical protein
MNFEQAKRLTGMLYGNILQRDADEQGFSFYCDALANDRMPLKQAIQEFYVSDEFAEKFIVNQTPNELARNVLHSFLDPKDISNADVKRVRGNLISQGLTTVVAGLLNDPRFMDRHGAYGVPRYVENRGPAA